MIYRFGMKQLNIQFSGHAKNDDLFKLLFQLFAPSVMLLIFLGRTSDNGFNI